jgi:hypothetical protein
MVPNRFWCLVCGYPDLGEPPWQNDSASDEICPSCGIHFGYDDSDGVDPAQREVVYREWRARWIATGMRWWSSGRNAPPGWDPQAQLRAVTD